MAIVAASCEYEPDNTYFKEVAQKNPAPLVVEFNQNDSLIYLWQPTEFSFNITPSGAEIKEGKVYLNNTLIGNIYTNSGIFNINPNHLPDGSYPLRIDFVIGSGSGSLADNLDAEVYFWQKNFILKVDRALTPCFITHFGIDQGRLKIDWELYPKQNFEKYFLDDFNNLVPPYEYTDINQTSFYDDRFIGGPGHYSFRVEAGGSASDLKYYTCEFPYPQPLEFQTENDNSLTIKWNRCLFYYNFSEYQITSNDF
jgi:hypothetical protein